MCIYAISDNLKGIQSKINRLTHCPTVHRQPIIQVSSQEWERIILPWSKVELRILTPSSTIHSGPITTLGPRTQVGETEAVGC